MVDDSFVETHLDDGGCHIDHRERQTLFVQRLHRGWGDGLAGLGRKSPVSLNDFTQIQDLRPVDRSSMFDILHQRGKAAATHLRAVLPSTVSV